MYNLLGAEVAEFALVDGFVGTIQISCDGIL